jgi:hypothetical protein
MAAFLSLTEEDEADLDLIDNLFSAVLDKQNELITSLVLKTAGLKAARSVLIKQSTYLKRLRDAEVDRPSPKRNRKEVVASGLFHLRDAIEEWEGLVEDVTLKVDEFYSDCRDVRDRARDRREKAEKEEASQASSSSSLPLAQEPPKSPFLVTDDEGEDEVIPETDLDEEEEERDANDGVTKVDRTPEGEEVLAPTQDNDAYLIPSDDEEEEEQAQVDTPMTILLTATSEYPPEYFV